jgi:citrate synthase
MTNSNTLSITDNRTGKQYEVPIENNTIKAIDLRKIKVSDDDFGLMTYDPAFMNTASCKSTITFIDGDKGILEYRGYPIEELAVKSSYLEVAYLLLHGVLPTEGQLKDWIWNITHHTFINEASRKLWMAFITTHIQWGCLFRRWARSERSILTLRTSSILSRAGSRFTG